jgi:hypothetical protein
MLDDYIVDLMHGFIVCLLHACKVGRIRDYSGGGSIVATGDIAPCNDPAARLIMITSL